MVRTEPLKFKYRKTLPKSLAERLTLWLISLAWLSLALGVGYAAPETERPGLARPLTVRWRYASSETLNLTPAVKGERIYMPLAGGALVALQAKDGALLWKNDSGGEISCAPEADDTSVYVASEAGDAANAPKGLVRAVSRETGITLWVRALQTPLYGLLVANEAAVFGISETGQVYALDKNKGEILWSAQAAPTLSSELTLSGNRLYVGSKEGLLLALDIAKGHIVWRFQAQGSIRGHLWVVADTLYGSTASGQVYALNKSSGALQWKRQAGPGVQAVTVNADHAYVASADNSLYLLHTLTGKRIWRQQLSSRVAAMPLAAPEGVLLTAIAGNLATVLNPRDGKLVNTLSLGDDGSTGAAPVFAQDMVLITGRKGLLAFANPGK